MRQPKSYAIRKPTQPIVEVPLDELLDCIVTCLIGEFGVSSKDLKNKPDHPETVIGWFPKGCSTEAELIKLFNLRANVLLEIVARKVEKHNGMTFLQAFDTDYICTSDDFRVALFRLVMEFIYDRESDDV